MDKESVAYAHNMSQMTSITGKSPKQATWNNPDSEIKYHIVSSHMQSLDLAKDIRLKKRDSWYKKRIWLGSMAIAQAREIST